MCFSAKSSFIAGAALSVIGVFTIKKTTQKTEIPFALIPLLFGIQQITEGTIWVSFFLNAIKLNVVMTYVYYFFSHVLWPIYIPFSILLLEPIPWRKKTITTFLVLGIATAFYLLCFMVNNPVHSQIINKSIVYSSPQLYIFILMLFYFAATCLSCLFSSYKLIKILGFLTLFSAILAYQFYALSFTSVWCFFAALLSVIIYFYFRKKEEEIKRVGCF